MDAVQERTRLQAKWRTILDEHEFDSVLVFDTSRSRWPSTLGYLRIQDSTGLAHDFRLSIRETAEFVTIQQNPDANYWYDPMSVYRPGTTVYQSTGVPDAVTEVLDALDVTPLLSDACADGEHEFEQLPQERSPTLHRCSRCENSVSILSWIGHAVDMPESEETP